jgi:flavin-dependent dehydrogenase
VVVGPQLFTVRTIDLQSGLERYYQRFYINVDREKFDRWLFSLVPPEVDTRLGAVFKSLERTGRGFKINYVQEGKSCAAHAGAVIGADGAFSMVRRAVFPALPPPPRYIAIQEWFAAPKAQPYFTTVFDSTITDFYCWTIPKEEWLLVGAALAPDRQAAGKFALLKERLGGYGFQLGSPAKREGAFILRPEKMSHLNPGARGVALLGEAAGWISPSSAEGLSYAFRSALLCARSLAGGTGGFVGRYRRYTAPMRRNILVKNLKAPFMYTPLLRKAVMRSGLLSMAVELPRLP